ncbi:MAG TPA: tRNA (5-methylaminomethyl-2-thiouridine)(34)-methyltransferase MnmD [Edaphocola sp.]|nr:tRNA (5-methylaminomethyl-2-thiouridine)(34)-methyltransferase MnmD [Edaphocola sp.]
MLQVLTSDDGSPTIFNPEIHETYHSKFGARSESEHVFIRNGLETILPKPNGCNILEIGFGSGLNALLTWQAAEKHLASIQYYSSEPFPVPVDLARQYARSAHFTATEQWYLMQLHQAPFGHPIKLSPYFSIHKIAAGIENYRSGLRFPLIYFDAFSPDKAPDLWTREIFQKLYHMCAPKGILVTYCAKGSVKRQLKATGFIVEALNGALGKREMTRAIKS